MKLLVFTLRFCSRDLVGYIIIKMIINTITQIRDKTANASRSNRTWNVKVKLMGDRKWKQKENNKSNTK